MSRISWDHCTTLSAMSGSSSIPSARATATASPTRSFIIACISGCEGLRDAVVQQDRQGIEDHVPAHLFPFRPPDVLDDLARNARLTEEGLNGPQVGSSNRPLDRRGHVGRLSPHLSEPGERSLSCRGLEVPFFLLRDIRTGRLPPRPDRHVPSFIMLDNP